MPESLLAGWRQAYQRLQPVLTPITGWLPVPALDIVIVVAAGWLAWRVVRWWRAEPSSRPSRGVVVQVLARAVTLAAAVWLAFLFAWGWHYQVPTLETRLAIQPDELSAARGEAFARAIVSTLNDAYANAHSRPWPSRREMPAMVGPRVAAVLPDVGEPWRPAWPHPRHSLVDLYFRTAGIDGMTNPFGLEVVLNSRVLPMELPALAAHEYAHLAGFADESDASVVAWLACQGGEAQLRYSAALAVLPHVLMGVPAAGRRAVLQQLGTGPRRDLHAINARLAEQLPWVRAVAWLTYDRFLKANRVGEGVARYDAVARVLVAVADPATGRLRRSPSAWPPGHR